MINCTAITSTVISNVTTVNDVVGIITAPIYQLLFTIKKFHFSFKNRGVHWDRTRNVRREPAISCPSGFDTWFPNTLYTLFQCYAMRAAEVPCALDKKVTLCLMPGQYIQPQVLGQALERNAILIVVSLPAG